MAEELVKVTQADRDAAEKFNIDLRAGLTGTQLHSLAGVLARHRLAGIEEGKRLAAAEDKYRIMLLDLLAVIHRDGGHKTHEIGIKLAWEQAMQLSSERIAAKEAYDCIRRPVIKHDSDARSGAAHYAVEEDRGLPLIMNAKQVGLDEAQLAAQPAPDRVEAVAFAIIEGSAGLRAAEHAKEFQTANWSDAIRSAQAALAAIAAVSQHGANPPNA